MGLTGFDSNGKAEGDVGLLITGNSKATKNRGILIGMNSFQGEARMAA